MILNSLTDLTRRLSDLERQVNHVHVNRTINDALVSQGSLQKNVISARAPWKLRWDFFVLVISLHSCISVPFLHTFLPNYASQDWAVSLSYSVDCLYIVDLFINFRTTQTTSHGLEVTEPREIAKRYLCSKFPVDLIAAVPIELLSYILAEKHSLFYSIWLLRMLRLSRLGKIIYYLRTQEAVKYSIKILHLLLFFLVYVHIVACSWYSLVSLEESWVPPLGSEELYDLYGVGAYAYFYYFALYTVLGTELWPSTRTEYIFMGFALLVGSLLHSIILGEAVVILTQMSGEEKRYNSVYDGINATARELGLSKEWHDKLTRFLVSSYGVTTRAEKRTQLLQRLPESLRRQVYFELYKGLFTHNCLFQQQPSLTFFAMYLLQYQCYLPEQPIVQQFARGTAMYFVSAGSCKVHMTDQAGKAKFIRVLGKGDYFGELSLLFSTYRTATVTSLGFTDIACLTHEGLWLIIRKFPGIHTELLARAAQYQDTYTQFTKKTLRQISYFRALDETQLQEVMYSLKRVSYPPNSHLFQEGEIATKAFIVLQGQVSIGFSIKDRSFKLPTERQLRRRQTEFSRRIRKRRCSVHSKLVLDDLGPGSVLASTHLIVGHHHYTSCKVLVQTLVLEYTLSTLEGLDIRPLKVQVHKTRAQHMHFDTHRHEYMSRFLPLDYSKGVYATRRWKNLFLFKSAVLRKIHFRRCNRLARVQCFPLVIKRIQAVLAAERLSLGLLAHDISRGRIVPEIMEAIHLIYPREARVPLRAQLAVQMRRLRCWKFESDWDLQSLHKQAMQNTCRIQGLMDTLCSVKELFRLATKFMS